MHERDGTSPPPSADAGGVQARLLSDIAASLSSEQDLEALLQRFLRAIVELAGARAGAARVLTDDGKGLRLVGAVGLPPDVLEREWSVELDCGFCGDAARHDTIAEATDLRRCAERTASRFFAEACVRIVAVPLRHRGRILGVYNLFLAHERRLTDEVSSLLRAIGELLGLALENARLTRESTRATLMHERHLMANEVHDSLAQTLWYMNLRLALLDKAMRERDETRGAGYLADVREALGGAYSSLRQLLTHFRSRMDPQGLLHALAATAATYRDKSGVELEFVNRAPELSLPVEHEVQVFHIVQEALANVSKHARARRARLVIDRRGGHYEITIEDDGAGIASDAAIPAVAFPGASSRFGLEIMRERARHLGGEVEVLGEPGAGTRVRLRFPASSAVADVDAAGSAVVP
ncbi:MAG: GAF domain-containing protein [Rudaea sp.]